MWRNPGGFFPCRTLCSPRGTSSFSPFVAGVGDAFISLIHFLVSLYQSWCFGRREDGNVAIPVEEFDIL